MSDHYGDWPLGSIIYMLFTTEVNFAPTDLAGSPAVSVYKDDSTTQTTTGVTLTVPFDTMTGLGHLKIDTSSDASFYAADHNFHAVLTTGTLGGISQVGWVIGSFRLSSERNNLDKTTKAIARGTVTTGASTTSVPTSALSIAGAAASGVVADQFKGGVIFFDGDTTTAGLRGVKKAITASTASNTPTLTVDTLPATPASGDLFSII